MNAGLGGSDRSGVTTLVVVAAAAAASVGHGRENKTLTGSAWSTSIASLAEQRFRAACTPLSVRDERLHPI